MYAFIYKYMYILNFLQSKSAFTLLFQIIITNTIASNMLGYSADELLLTKFCDLIHKEKSQLALPDMFFNEKGDIVVYNGKVVCFSIQSNIRGVNHLKVSCLD